MCDCHGEEPLPGRLAKETLLPPGRPAASPPRAPLAARGRPAALLGPRVSARPNPAAPCCPRLAARPPRLRRRRPRGSAARSPPLPRPAGRGHPGSSAGLALAPLAPQEPRDVTRGRPAPLAVGARRSGLGTCLRPSPVPCARPSLVGPAGRLLPTLCPGSSNGGGSGGVSFLHILENYGNWSHQCFPRRPRSGVCLALSSRVLPSHHPGFKWEVGLRSPGESDGCLLFGGEGNGVWRRSQTPQRCERYSQSCHVCRSCDDFS